MSTLCIGALVLFGWWLEIDPLKWLIPGAVTMKPNTALGLLLCGASLWQLRREATARRSRRIGRACAGAAALLGLLTLMEYLLALDFGIDNLLASEPPGALQTSQPGRMAPGTALGFLLFGSALSTLDLESGAGRRPAQYLALPPLAIAFTALMGYLYGLGSLYGPGPYTAMALHTAIAFFILGLGILLARPRRGWMRQISGDDPGGAMLRHLLPVILILIPLLFWVRLLGEKAGWYGTELGIFLMILMSMVLLTATAWWGARSLNRSESVRRRVERGLRRSEENLREAQQLAGLGHWRWDLKSDTHRWSEEIYHIYGRDPTLPAAVYPEVKQYFTPRSWDRLAAEVETALAAGTPYACDAEVVRPDGTHRWIVARGEANRDAEGNIVDLHGTVQDITDRKAAEAELALGTQRLRRLAEVVERIAAARTLHELMAVVRRAVRELTGADGVTLILREDDACHYADEDAIGPLWKGQRFPLESCISGWTMLHAEPAVIEDIYADERIPHEAYRPTFVKSLAMVPVGRKRPVAAIGCYWRERHLATDREREMQQALADAMSVGLVNVDLYQNLERRVTERTAELAAANRELDSFAYAVSHDLRAPLRAMSGFSQALVEDYGEQMEEDARLYLEQIQQASRRMNELIDGLLTLSRSTRGELRRERLDLSAMARRLIAELARNESRRQVAVEIEDGIEVQGDPGMLEAVLTNLLGNAWKYSARAAEPRIRLYSENRGGARWICIMDNGAGFDPAYAEKLFQPFQRLHRQEEFPGIGIGLATVQRIVLRHGGEIEASGEPGRGATLRFTLPDPDSPSGTSTDHREE